MSNYSRSNISFLVVLLLSTIMSDYARADSEKLTIELNAQKQQGTSCRVSFVMKNDIQKAVDELKLEIVLFDQKQQVASVLVISAGALPIGKTRVKQYGLKNTNCNDISRFLVNDVKTCDGAGLTPEHCLARLKLTSRTNSVFGS